jgi:NADPH:quinone reductase-like Zn-dependent oxidoreductase
MKAIVYSAYGPPEVLQLQEVEKPAPRENEVLIKVHAASVTFGDVAVVRGEPVVARLWSGLTKPKFPTPGKDVAGEVEAIGSSVKQFQPGEAVYGDISAFGWGTFAEYVAVDARAVAPMPANISFAEAAAVPESAVVALQGLRDKGQIQAGQKVLIVGASGGIGTFAVQIAKAFGAEVTGVCSARNVELVQGLGADHVIDYTKEDFAAKGPQYDLILATAGHRSLADYRRALNPSGIYVAAGGSMAQIFQAMLGPLLTIGSSQEMGNFTVKPNQEDLVFMKELIEEGKVTPVIDRHYPLSQTAEAMRYYSQGRTRGKVVITMNHDA